MKLEDRILQTNGNVLLRSELASLGSASQLTRALQALVATGALVRIGVGIYAKTRASSVTGATVPAGSLETLAMEALQKLGVVVEGGAVAQAYNEGSTQLPGAFVVSTGRRRIRRRIEVGGRVLVYERG